MKRKTQNSPVVIRHFIKGKFVRAIQIRGQQCVIGSSRAARLRLLTGEVAGVCCVLERHGDGWNVIDVGSQPDLKVNGRPFSEHLFTGKTVLEIGEHRLELFPKRKPRSIFEDDFKDVKKGELLHVVKWHGKVLETLETDEEVATFDKIEHDSLEIMKVYRPKVPMIGKEKLALDPELKRPMAVTLLAIVIFFAVLFGIPMPKEEQVKPTDNVYTRMIYDSKVLTAKRKQLVSFGMKTPKGTGNGNGQISEGAKGTQSKAIKAVASLRQAGLQSLIGKIAGRASKSAKMIAALAATPSAEASVEHGTLGGFGGNTPSVGAANGKTGILGNGKGFTVGGIGTGGKGGGTGGYKAGTGLGTGAIGNGEVGLEDEDSVVEGGLDREVIAAVIKEHLGQIRYCYERQLSANPELYGKIKVRFSIDAEGAVDSQGIGQSTLKSAMVEECILRRIATWKFPKPKGGTKVLVSYPFLFKSVN